MKFERIICALMTVVIVCGQPIAKEQQTSGQFEPNSKGIFQSITDTIKEYTVNKVLNMFKNLPVECKSKVKKSGRLIATKKGKAFCEKRCLEIYEKIDSAIETLNSIKSYIPFGQNLKMKPRQYKNLPKFKCAENLTKNKLLCDCPQAPQFSFGKSFGKYLERTFLQPSNAKRDKHWKKYGAPYYGYNGYYNGYGPPPYYHGNHWGGGFNPLGDLFSLIFFPLKILFFFVTLPFWIFLLVFLGIELDDIFD